MALLSGEAGVVTKGSFSGMDIIYLRRVGSELVVKRVRIANFRHFEPVTLLVTRQGRKLLVNLLDHLNTHSEGKAVS